MEFQKKNLYGIVATVHISSEIQCLPYAGFFLSPDPDSGSYTFSPSWPELGIEDINKHCPDVRGGSHEGYKEVQEISKQRLEGIKETFQGSF